MLTLLVQGFGKSLEIFALTLLGSLPLGLLVMFGRRSRVAPLRWLVKLFISVMRGTPLMLQLMVVYYGPFLLFNFTPPGNWRFGAVIVGFVINYAAYFAEIYRAGYESIPVGQFEAAQVLGYTGGQTFGRILLPQMIRRVLPPVTNEVITLVKDTSLASVIGTVEMFTRAKQIVASPNTPGMLALAAAGLFRRDDGRGGKERLRGQGCAAADQKPLRAGVPAVQPFPALHGAQKRDGRAAHCAETRARRGAGAGALPA